MQVLFNNHIIKIIHIKIMFNKTLIKNINNMIINHNNKIFIINILNKFINKFRSLNKIEKT